MLLYAQSMAIPVCTMEMNPRTWLVQIIVDDRKKVGLWMGSYGLVTSLRFSEKYLLYLVLPSF